MCPLSVLLCLCGVLGHLAPVHRCARLVCCVACVVSRATLLLFTGVPAHCPALRGRCPGLLGSCPPVCPRRLLCCVCGVWGHLAPVHRCSRSVLCFAFAVSSATCVLFTGVPARCILLRVRCPGPLWSCSPVCPLGALLCVCGDLGHLAPFHRCVCVVCGVASAVSWATWLLFTGVRAPSFALLSRYPRSLATCSPVCWLGVLCCVCGVLVLLAPVHRRAHLVLCFALLVWCPGPLGSCSPVCLLRPLLCLCSVLGHLAPVDCCARSVCCVARAMSWATWLLFTGVSARCVVVRVRCPRPLGSCSPVWLLGVLCLVCGVLGHLAPVHRCARSVLCFAFAVSWATCLLFTGVPAQCVVLRARCPCPLGSGSPVCLFRPLLCLCSVLGHLAPVHRCPCSVRCFASAVSWANWLLLTAVPARCVVLRVRCPRPLGSCSPVCLLGVLCCVYRVLCNLALVHRCACSLCCVGCVVSWATWLLFTGVLARCVVLCVGCAVLWVRGVVAGRSLVQPDGRCS